MKDKPVSIFISYSHADDEFRRQLLTHLGTLKRQGVVNEWHDRLIDPGTDANREIDKNLDNADIILLLVSADFINSLYCWEVELARSMERSGAGEAVLIPIILRSVDLNDVPFASIQSLPTNRKPVDLWTNRDQAWLDVIDGIRKIIKRIQDRRQRAKEESKVTSIKHILSDGKDDDLTSELRTGYVEIDRMLSGLGNSELIIVASRPGMGKTAFVLSVALNASIAQMAPVLMFSMETPRVELTYKAVSALSRTNGSLMRQGQIIDDEFARINGASGMLKSAPFFIDDTPSVSTSDVLARSKAIKEEHGLALIIIDQLQMMKIDSPNRPSNVGASLTLARELKSVARTLNVPIIVTSQVNSKVDRRIDKIPLLSDLPDGEQIEDYADVVLFIHRDEVYDTWTTRKGIADVQIAKQRKGPTGQVQLVFFGEYSTFDNIVAMESSIESEIK